MYYQGLLSLIAPSQMMICGTMTLRYLFRIVLSGAVTKDAHFITSGLVTRQGGTTQPSPITFPVSFASKCLTVVPQLQAPGDTGNMSKNRVECTTMGRTGRTTMPRLLTLAAIPLHFLMHALRSRVAQNATRIICMLTEPGIILSGKTAHNFVMRLVQSSKANTSSG